MIMPPSALEQIDREFLQRLYDLSNGDTSVQISMYEVGEALGLDRDASSHVAQTLIGLNLVEIKTLSGGIGIGADGISEIENADGAEGSSAAGTHMLGDSAVLSPTDVDAVTAVSDFLKSQAGSLGLTYGSLAELTADLRTIDAQLASSRPKTDIVRACFKSIEGLMDRAGHREALNRLRALIGA